MFNIPSATPSTGTAGLWWGAVVAYMAFIFALSSISRPPAMAGGVDKYLHALLYSGLGALVSRALAHGWRRVTFAQVCTAALISALYGVSDEVHQYFNPPRHVEALDVVADTIGASAAAVALYAWGIIRGRDGV